MQVVIYGSRLDGHAKVCVNLARALGWTCAGLLDDWPENAGNAIGPYAVLGGRELLPELAARGVEGVLLGFGQGRGRHELVAPVRAAALALPPAVHPDANVDPTARVGDGAVVLRGAVLADDVRVGEAVLVNAGAILSHDVMVEDGASVGPGCVLAGRSRVGRDAELGAGVVLLPDAVVGEGAVVGAGAVVVEAVEPGATVVGVPARPLVR